MIIEGKELPARVNPNAPPTKDEVQQVLKPAPGPAQRGSGRTSSAGLAKESRERRVASNTAAKHKGRPKWAAQFFVALASASSCSDLVRQMLPAFYDASSCRVQELGFSH